MATDVRVELVPMGQYGRTASARLIRVGRDDQGRHARDEWCGHLHRSAEKARDCAAKKWPGMTVVPGI